MKKYFLIYFIFGPLLSFAQQNDSILNQSRFIWFVQNYHPISVQANLQIQKGENAVQAAKGGFDPKIYTDLNQKYYDDKSYYSLLNSGLKIPTWYGVELKGGYNSNNGDYLDPENTLPEDGLWYTGVSLTLGKGLMIDQRRAVLKQSKIYQQQTEVEQANILNNLFLNANKQYWKWVKSWNKYEVYQSAYEVSLDRFEAVKQSFVFGDKPAIDTVEALIQLQNIELNMTKSLLKYNNEKIALSNYLWYKNSTPLEIPDSLFPPTLPLTNIILNSLIISEDSLSQIMNNISGAHPTVQLYSFKLASLEIDRRMKKEALKPELNLNYNLLSSPMNSQNSPFFNINDYKWGATFSFPIFLRKERGKLALTNIKILETELSQKQKILEYQNKVKAYYIEQRNLESQIDIYEQTVDNYSLMLQGEQKKFDNGESSLFILNSRENYLIKSQLQILDLQADYEISKLKFIWSTGRLYNFN